MKAGAETNTLPGRGFAGDDLLRAGRPLKVLAIVVIILLSIGVGVLAFHQWMESGALNKLMQSENQAVYSFGLLMLLTVGYLVGKGWSTTRDQRTLISRLLQEEAISRARHLDPIMEFHHPDLCREILRRQASYAGRIQSPISLVELHVADFGKLALEEQYRPFAGKFYQELRLDSRALDFWVRWTSNSFLLVLLEVSPEQASEVVYRLRSRLDHWWAQQPEVAFPTHFEWRYRTVGSLGASSDILREIRSLMEPDLFVPTLVPDVWQARAEPAALGDAAAAGKGRSSR